MPVFTIHVYNVSVLFTVRNKEPQLFLSNQLGRPLQQENHSSLQPECGECVFSGWLYVSTYPLFAYLGTPSHCYLSSIDCFIFQRGPADTQHIDPEFTREMVPNSVSRSPELNDSSSSSSNNAFNGFSFVGTEDSFL